MKVLLLIAMFGGIANPQTTDAMYDWARDSSMGYLPEIIVTALRYEHEDIAWSGLMETVIVTAPRYLEEEIDFVGAANISNNDIPKNKKVSFINNTRGQENILLQYANFQTQLLPAVLPIFFLMIIGVLLLIQRSTRQPCTAKRVCTGRRFQNNAMQSCGSKE